MSDEPCDIPTKDEIEAMLYTLAAMYGLDIKVDVTVADNTATNESEQEQS